MKNPKISPSMNLSTYSGVKISRILLVCILKGIHTLAFLMYKLRMFSVPIDGVPRIFCDNNQYVVTSSNYSETTLKIKKKHCSMAWHVTKLGKQLLQEKILYYEKSESNLGDMLLTKVLTAIKLVLGMVVLVVTPQSQIFPY